MNDLISKEQMRTILSSLKDYIDNNREENSINIKQTVIGSESDWLTEGNTTKTITLTDNINNYDYLVFVLEFRRGTSTSYENHTVLARVGYTNSINVDHSIGSDDKDGTYIIKVSIGTTSDTGAYIYQGSRGSAYSGARIKEVIGIKLNTLSTADIAEMAMPSDVYITLEPNTTTSDKLYTAPANGYIFATSEKWVQVWNDYTVLSGSFSGYYGGSIGVARTIVPVRKGATVNYYGGATTEAKFIYSVGDAKALGLI